ncbi:hypothetical protein BSKO_01601 [Bryopsis sp. KO-2023]|nr:hypothetical protein BSKO_01601 [Bryopsis sp. KO-2023]
MSATVLGGLTPLTLRLASRAERLSTATRRRSVPIDTRCDGRIGAPSDRPAGPHIGPCRRRTLVRCRTVNSSTAVGSCVVEDASSVGGKEKTEEPAVSEQRQAELSAFRKMRQERRKNIRREQMMYMVTAIAATSLMGFLAVFATYYRFIFLRGGAANFPWVEFAATLVLVFCGVAAMEMYARFAHKVLWHDFKPGWALHKSHHEPRMGPFEANDLYAVANAVPAISLCAYGFFHTGLVGGICFGCGLGITLFGIMYMFVHDGLVHKRFPVGPIANVPYLKRVAAAHKLHHSEKYGGLPWGMFLGPQELKNSPEALKEMEALMRLGKREETRELKNRLRKATVQKKPLQDGNGPSVPSPLPMPA